jgi:hypothetical protein
MAMTATQAVTIPMPDRIAELARNGAGVPIPYFVARVDGRPDFRVADRRKFHLCLRANLCWLCGQRLGRYKSFAIGPMCVVNRISSEPPSHRDCSIYALQACPFLTRPNAVRREAGKPEGVTHAGTMILTNPGVCALWVCETFTVFQAGDGQLVELGEPSEVTWWTEARTAVRGEVLWAMMAGLPRLREVAAEDGADALADLQRCIDRAQRFLPDV